MAENPPAFPYRTRDAAGMTLRDWFAGQALAGMVGQEQDRAPEYAYWLADKMLALRSTALPTPES